MYIPNNANEKQNLPLLKIKIIGVKVWTLHNPKDWLKFSKVFILTNEKTKSLGTIIIYYAMIPPFPEIYASWIFLIDDLLLLNIYEII